MREKNTCKELIKDTFKQLRYCFELKGFAVKLRFLVEFSKSLMKYCMEKKNIKSEGQTGKDV